MNSRFPLQALAVTLALGMSVGQPSAVAASVTKAVPGVTPPPVNPALNGRLGNASLAQCAPGFFKSSEHKDSLGRIDKFVCMTPIIVCPQNPNYPATRAQGKVNTNAENDPEHGVLTLVYSCIYSPLVP